MIGANQSAENWGKPKAITRITKRTQLAREEKNMNSCASLAYLPREYFSIKFAVAHKRGASRAKNSQLVSISLTLRLGLHMER
jgi:hypothetical protein